MYDNVDVLRFDDYSIIFPGRVVKYYVDKQEADVVISAERVYSDSTRKHALATRTELKRVPVHTPSGGGWSMTMPIKPGDTCILFFSQVGYDHWLYSDLDEGGKLAGNPRPHLKRKFSLNDGYALVGLNTNPRAIQSYHPTHSQWRSETASQVISLNDDLSITITSPVQVTVNAPKVIVNAPETEVNCDTLQVNATDSVEFDTPLVNFTGIFNLGSLTMNDHIHPENDNGGPTDGPINGV